MRKIQNLGNKRTQVEFTSMNDLNKWFHSKHNNDLFCDFRFRNTYHVCNVDDNFVYIHIINTNEGKALKIPFSEFLKAQTIFIR